jgi:hypothetical protein
MEPNDTELDKQAVAMNSALLLAQLRRDTLLRAERVYKALADTNEAMRRALRVCEREEPGDRWDGLS